MSAFDVRHVGMPCEAGHMALVRIAAAHQSPLPICHETSCRTSQTDSGNGETL